MERAKILIVEDDMPTAADLESVLQELGHEVPRVLHGVAGAVEAARETEADLALVNIHLGVSGDGVGLAESLDVELGIPVVYVTAFDDEETLARARAAGPSGYLFKPFGQEELEAVVNMSLHAHRTREELRSSERRYRILFEENVAGVLRKSGDGTILECNRAFAEIMGYESPEALVGESAEILYLAQEDREFFRRKLHDQGKVRNLELRMRRRDGAPVWVLDNSVITGDPGGGQEVILSTVLDISDRKSVEISLRDMAYRDVLTGLPNRRHLEEQAPQILAIADRRDGRAGLLFMDLVGFKKVNDTYGHRAGDQVLIETGRRLESQLRASDTLVRLGGDEFAILLAEVDSAKGARTAAVRLIEHAGRPLTLESGQEIRVGARSGAAIYPNDGRSFDELLTRADQAVARAKRVGGSVVVMASEERSSAEESTSA